MIFISCIDVLGNCRLSIAHIHLCNTLIICGDRGRYNINAYILTQSRYHIKKTMKGLLYVIVDDLFNEKSGTTQKKMLLVCVPSILMIRKNSDKNVTTKLHWRRAGPMFVVLSKLFVSWSVLSSYLTGICCMSTRVPVAYFSFLSGAIVHIKLAYVHSFHTNIPFYTLCPTLFFFSFVHFVLYTLVRHCCNPN